MHGLHAGVTRRTLLVTGDTCARCARALVDELRTVAGIVSVDLDPPSGTLVLACVPGTDDAAIHLAIDDAGFTLR